MEASALVVWLDLPYWLILYQVISRTIRRSVTKETLWAGNRNSLRKAFFSRNSIIWWCLTNLRQVRRQYLAAMSVLAWVTSGLSEYDPDRNWPTL